MEAQLIFERHFTDGVFVKWYPDNMDDCLVMDINNRYLKTKNAHPQEQSLFEKMQTTEPQVFHIGDIVEVQLSIITISTRTGQKRLKLKLSNILTIELKSLQEREGLMHNVQEKTTQKEKGEAPKATLKRKVGY
ncbi:uncharacterized protein ARMOST_16720 [Armillaria ostoyae]|uniref:Uncharacterized protein n=1 Tax=Armillaria ostoyae TaxID=47428 RepID=A0A284RX11_ARMOS|nr:uncharacterized protein ARMOST_16720 [Armillaria ostoyae]